MKISELNTNTFLNNSGSPENSYLLINYASAQGAAPATQQVSLDTLGKAVAAKLNLPIAVTDNQGNVTGLQHVVATGNQYQIENLNAQFGGGSGGGYSNAIQVLIPATEEGQDPTPAYAVPVYFLPYNGKEYAYTSDLSTAMEGTSRIVVLNDVEGQNLPVALSLMPSIQTNEEKTVTDIAYYPSMGGSGSGSES